MKNDQSPFGADGKRVQLLGDGIARTWDVGWSALARSPVLQQV
jgi:hypothetical protein